MRTFENKEDFVNNFIAYDCYKLNKEKAQWYFERPYIAFETKSEDFYEEAVKAGIILNP